LTKKEKYGIMLKMKSIIDGYNSGYEDAEKTILAKLEAMISDAEIVSKLYDSVETAEACYALKNVRRTLFAKYINEE
jgi:hypothetical protein